ncbi:DUF3630 domain-containing protein [Idiomarina sp. OT37-5b]|jgi:hypothetical protein|uniref:DUF3630 family protein n=1 Tax=Idiomarina sp. OT37-5b TaxID=2100422 RepID=UPI000CF953B6|nr:DUF3630 family protein [Idiomarina sp. OT37-5b]AVJ57162.1 DUF3630 domain-containing protein [Idiomarina sp. OT37-5b]
MADLDTLILKHRPTAETDIDSWASDVAAALDATIRESELAADQYCWRLSIRNRHWLLFYSHLCEAAWLQPLEGVDKEVMTALQAEDYI